MKPLTEADTAVLRAFADHNMDTSKTARALYMHRNTVVYHLDKIQKQTHVDPRSFYGLSYLLRRAVKRA